MDREQRGRREFSGLVGGDPDEALAAVRQRSPELYSEMIAGGFAGPMARADLSRSDREVATVAMLAAMGGAEPQLALHTRTALRQGLSASELLALCEHVGLYAGYPRALNALTVVDQVLTEAGYDRPARLRRITLTDHETVVAERGAAGPPVVLVHPLGLDWHTWEPVMAELARGRRVYAYDVRGHGRAEDAPTPFTIADTGRDLVDVLDALDLERAHLVGLSLGGAVAQAAAIRAPDRVASLALLGTTDEPLPDVFEARARTIESSEPADLIPGTMTRWFTPEALAVNGWGVRYAREKLRRSDPVIHAAVWRAYKSLDVRGRLTDFAAPTLVVAGECDVSATPELMSALAKRISGATYHELPNTPHMQTLEQPALVLRVLDDFLPVA